MGQGSEDKNFTKADCNGSDDRESLVVTAVEVRFCAVSSWA